MKKSKEFKYVTYQTLYEFRIHCRHIRGAVVVDRDTVREEVHNCVRDVTELRLLELYAPLFRTIGVVIALLGVLSSADAREYHGRHRHHRDSVERSTSVYVPPRVEPQQVPSPFEVGGDNVGWSYLGPVRPPIRVEWSIPIPTPKVYRHDVPQEFVGRLTLASGVGVIMAYLGWLMTGHWPMLRQRGRLFNLAKPRVTLVEAKTWLPRRVSVAWCNVKHRLRLH